MAAQKPPVAPSASFATTRQLVLRVALTFVLISAAFQYLFRVRLDPYKCRSILHSGTWPSPRPGRGPHVRWSPDDSRLHEHSAPDISRCLAGRRIVFVGDSWVRQLYWATAARLDRTKQETAVLDFYLDDEKQTDLAFNADGVYVEFVWDPWLNSTAFRGQLDKFRRAPEPVVLGAEGNASPGLLVVGAPGLWAARHGGDSFAGLFRTGVDQLLPYLDDDLGTTHMSHTKTPDAPTEWLPNQLLLVPVPVPDYSRLTSARRAVIKPDKIDAMNAYLARWPAVAQSHMPWVFNRMLESDAAAYAEDGIHMVRAVRDRAVTVLLNARCNAGLDPHWEHTASLGCISYGRPGAVQLCVLAACAAAAALMFVRRHDTALAAAVGELAPLGLAAVLSYLAEKTHVSINADRPRSRTAFAFLLAGIALAYLASLRRLDGGRQFLPREHTDEWKGHLQTLLLLLSYFDAFTPLSTYRALRLAASAYVFLSTYGHAMYFLETGDYSARRVARVLLRLNLLGCLLSFALDGAWTTYLSPPVISTWFLVTYAVLRLRSRDNDNMGLLLGKVVAAAVVVNVVVLPPEWVMHIANLVNAISRSSWDSWKMNQDLEKDRVMPFVGILAACIAHRVARLRSESAPRSQDRVSSLIDGVISMVSNASLRVGGFNLGLYPVLNLTALTVSYTLVHRTTNGEDYKALHPFCSSLIILSATALRSSALLRPVSLALPTSLGRIAQETHVLHYHVLLASRGTTVLSLWPKTTGPLGTALFYSERAFLAATFFWLAGMVHNATRGAVGLLLGLEAAPEEERAERGEKRVKRVKIGGRVALFGSWKGRVLGLGVVVWVGSILYGL